MKGAPPLFCSCQLILPLGTTPPYYPPPTPPGLRAHRGTERAPTHRPSIPPGSTCAISAEHIQLSAGYILSSPPRLHRTHKGHSSRRRKIQSFSHNGIAFQIVKMTFLLCASLMAGDGAISLLDGGGGEKCWMGLGMVLKVPLCV